MQTAATKPGQSRNNAWTIRSVLQWTEQRFSRAGIDSARLDAELLLAHALKVERLQLYLQHDKPLLERELAQFRGLVKRRLRREPVAYVLGHREFWSLTFEVNRAVLVPRPETELLVELALRVVDSQDAAGPLTVVDLCTGSGAVACAVKHERSACRVIGSDICETALSIARQNAAAHGLLIDFYQGDLLRALPADLCIDILLCNPPYLCRAEYSTLMPEVRQWEPMRALIAGDDGLDLIRPLVAQAADRLAKGAFFATELDPQQSPAVCAMLSDAGFERVAEHPDLSGQTRVVSGHKR